METWKKPSAPVRSVGLIGAGVMGRCMLERMLQKDYAVCVYDAFPAAAQQAGEMGGQVLSSPREVAQNSDIVLLSLPGPAQIEEVVFGENGLFDVLRPGQVVVDTSTVDPGTSKQTGPRVAEKGAAYLDCPILGRPSAVGNWMLPTGGDTEAAGYAEPVLLTFACKIIPAGGHGAGNALKLLNQMMYSVINAVTTEVMAIADKVGVGKEVFYDTVANSSAATVSGLFREVGRNIIDHNYDHPVFTVDLLIKDAALALKMSKDANAPSVISGYVQLFNELASANGLGGKDVSALHEIYKRNYREEIAQ